MSLLIVTAVPAEAEAVRKGLDKGSRIVVAPVGVGMAAAAAGTARLLTLADGRYRGVLNFGIGGGFAQPLGGTVLAQRVIAADLGAESPNGFISLDDLGFGETTISVDQRLLTELRAAMPDAPTGDILTVNTVTGTSERTAWMIEKYPHAIAEGMEGYGVAVAARQAAVPFAELRTISNIIGPRDRDTWQIADALAALTKAAQLLARAKQRA